MATKEIVDLKPQNVWRNFYKLTRIPRPTGHMKEITKFMMEFGKSLDLETLQDRAGNVLIRKPASKGYEGKQTVILQAHLDMVPQQMCIRDRMNACSLTVKRYSISYHVCNKTLSMP